ncbi:polysaccharide deacetylase family protein [Paenibacillus sp. P96]|uniref:Polysaccharide deacetylase family protein n=1 Tax=Paenibacillus zeirhizosphaerae TaxID=2987519 RepID=A0ABT9FKJ4_9BACL|nr:polysaccharide deacetylase family protein [Paenibacillus sp. P96]MDP4095235.1 polysaccharide deacetylase family protein [Paenibacillus sp. P96]
MQNVLLWLFYITSFYAFIPGLISRLFGFRVFRRGKKEEQAFALTFDDGPDPVYTPQLLDLLQRFDAKATFFVVGVNAEKHPAILRRIHDEGHLIGIHNYVHKSNWFMRPATVRKQILCTEQIIREVTGDRAAYYRPPWGIVNLFDFAKSNGRRIVLWSSMFGDWRVRTGVDRLTRRMLQKLRGGEIMLLHDCGRTLGANADAPQNMLVALERVLIEAGRRGLRSVRIDELAGGAVEMNATHSEGWFKKVIVRSWLLYERAFHTLFRLEPANPQEPMLHFRRRKYKGQPVDFADGVSLVKGDDVLELHFDNERLYQIGSTAKTPMHVAIQMIRSVEKQLPDLAARLAADSQLEKVKAVYGVSMINRGAEKLGFMVRDLPSGLFASSSKLYLRLLLSVIHPSGQERLKRRSDVLVPKLIVMPVSVLTGRFLKNDSVGSGMTLNDHPLPEHPEEMGMGTASAQTVNSSTSTIA